jgi:hypothetical protein
MVKIFAYALMAVLLCVTVDGMKGKKKKGIFKDNNRGKKQCINKMFEPASSFKDVARKDRIDRAFADALAQHTCLAVAPAPQHTPQAFVVLTTHCI